MNWDGTSGGPQRDSAASSAETVDIDSAQGPAECCLYAIGDIHGRLDLLDRLLDAIAADPGRADGRNVRLVALGDYVDRGPDSMGVIDRLCDLQDDGSDVVCLRGNHEQMMRDFLKDPIGTACWLPNGGIETLKSYGIRAPETHNALAPHHLIALSAALRNALPERHRQFLNTLSDCHEAGDYFFAHAGINPDLSLNEQRPEDLMWIREPFLYSRALYTKVIVHGHTITRTVDLHPNRIGLDTGSFYSGILTGMAFDGGERRILQAAAD